jgi:ABC-2 type transport system permease protein
VGAFAGAFLVLAMQFETVLPAAARDAIRKWLASEESAAWLGPHSVLTWPARALFGDPLPLVATLTVSLGAFILVTRLTADAFASAVQEGAALTARRRSDAGTRRAFASGLARIVIAKELRLIARDPALIARALVQLLYFVPLMLILGRNAHLAAVLAASLVAIAASLAGTFAYITVSGEEAPDLVGTAPVSGERVRWLKAAAALVPVGVLVLPFLAWYALHSLFMFAVLLACLAAALLSSAVIQVWSGVPGSARDLRKRHTQNPLLNMVEALSSFGWAGACYLAIAGHARAAVAAALFGLVGPLAAWLGARMREE